jgi:hypothetical protein
MIVKYKKTRTRSGSQMNTWEIKNTDINIKEKEKVASHISCWNLCSVGDSESNFHFISSDTNYPRLYRHFGPAMTCQVQHEYFN